MTTSDQPLSGPDGLGPVLEAAGRGGARCVEFARLPGGTYNTLYRIRLDDGEDGEDLVLKLPPAPGTPHLTYERDLLRNEAEFYRAVAGVAGVAAPEVVFCDPDGAVLDGGFLLMSLCPGVPWYEVPLDEAERGRLRRELGGLVAHVHTVTGTGFGYPSGAVARADTWRAAFTAMLEALLGYAERFGARLPVPADHVRAVTEAAAPALDEVTVPTLVHFDLWDGNILLTGTGADTRIGAVVDGERMFWGDPLAELCALNLFGPPDADPHLLAGYRAAGGTAVFDDAARARMALYRCYLYLIMLVEGVPRGYSDARLAKTGENAGGVLASALDVLAMTSGGRR